MERQATGDLLMGQVTLNDSPSKARLYRFCEKKIDQWLHEHLAAEHPGAEFRVSFTADEEQISCVTEIQLGNSLWRGCELAHDAQLAFMQSLKRLQPH